MGSLEELLPDLWVAVEARFQKSEVDHDRAPRVFPNRCGGTCVAIGGPWGSVAA